MESCSGCETCMPLCMGTRNCFACCLGRCYVCSVDPCAQHLSVCSALLQTVAEALTSSACICFCGVVEETHVPSDVDGSSPGLVAIRCYYYYSTITVVLSLCISPPWSASFKHSCASLPKHSPDVIDLQPPCLEPNGSRPAGGRPCLIAQVPAAGTSLRAARACSILGAKAICCSAWEGHSSWHPRPIPSPSACALISPRTTEHASMCLRCSGQPIQGTTIASARRPRAPPALERLTISTRACSAMRSGGAVARPPPWGAASRAQDGMPVQRVAQQRRAAGRHLRADLRRHHGFGTGRVQHTGVQVQTPAAASCASCTHFRGVPRPRGELAGCRTRCTVP